MFSIHKVFFLSFLAMIFSSLILGSSLMLSASPTESNEVIASQGKLPKFAFSPGGQILASVGHKDQIILWDIASGKKVSIFSGKEDVAVAGLSFSPDGLLLSSLGEDSQVTLWNIASDQEHLVLPTRIGSGITDFVFAPDGRILASASKDGGIALWNVATGQAVKTLAGHTDTVTGIAFSPDGALLASSSYNAPIKLWDIRTGQEYLTLSGTNGIGVTKVIFSPDGKVLVSIDEADQMAWWDVATGQKRLTIAGPRGASIVGTLFSPDGKILLSGSENGQIFFWDAQTGQELFMISAGKAAVIKVAFSPDGKTLASVSQDKQVMLWDALTGMLKQTINGQTDCSFSPDGKILASINDENQVVIWQIAAGTQYLSIHSLVPETSSPDQESSTLGGGQNSSFISTAPLNSNQTGMQSEAVQILRIGSADGSKTLTNQKSQKRARKGVTALAVSPDGNSFVSASHSGQVQLRDIKSNKKLLALPLHQFPVSGVVFSADSKQVITASRDTSIRVWNAATGQRNQILQGPAHPIRAIVASPDGRFLASGGEETKVMVRDAMTGKLIKILAGHSDFVNGLAFSPDGTMLASAGADHIIKMWKMTANQPLKTLKGHSGEINQVAFSPNGQLLASGANDSLLILWNVATGQPVQVFQGHQSPVRALVFSPNGSTLASADENSTIRVWDIPSRKLRKILQGTYPINTLIFRPDGQSIISGDEQDILTDWDVEKGTKRQTILVVSASGQAPDLLDATQTTRPSQPDIVQSASALSPQGALVWLLDWLIPPAAAAIPTPPGGPILVITSTSPISTYRNYYTEILRNEGFNAFAVADISAVTSEAALAAYDIVILAPMPLSADQVTMLTNWANAGGHLIAMRPDKKLAGLLGLSDAASTLANSYLLIDTSKAPGYGMVNQTIQFHDSADLYTLGSASSLATLYATASTATPNPAVTLRSVGDHGGQVAAFTYDLATSVVYTRQGNPAWATQERDGYSPIRSDDKFYGNATSDPQPDWVDLNKAAIPQADEQQRLLANLILAMNSDKKPLPRFWYFPHGKKAVVIMTGDDHGNNGTAGRFDQFITASPAGCSVANWECVRGTSYIYPNTPLTNDQAATYNAAGFEVVLHINTNCADFTPASLESFYTQQMSEWAAKYTSIPAPITQRHHCIAWSDWVTAAKVQLTHGIRLDTSYYFWPPGWVLNRPGFFTGSGMPMRFADLDGALIDVYHAATQMTDESGQQYPYTINTLLDRALGAEGYYGAYTVNAHTDLAQILEADAVVASALSRNVPIVSSRQMLDWLDGRNNSSFGSIIWSGNTLSFNIVPGAGANGLQVMIPMISSAGILTGITRNTSQMPFTSDLIKGVQYAFVSATVGSYVATYGTDTILPTVTSTSPANSATGISQSAPITATFSEALDVATVSGSTFELQNASNGLVSAIVTYNAETKTATLTSSSSLAVSTTYTATIKGGATDPRIKDLVGNALAANFVWSFTTDAGPTCPCSGWSSGATTPANSSVSDANAVELGVKFRADVAGFITGIRFYKGTGNTGVHTGTLWSNGGQSLATATFSNETATGWQQVNFAAPVAITANTVYVASYYAPAGGYAADLGYFANIGVDNGPVHLLRDGISGGNGVYQYGVSSFPANTYQSTNYWVDVVFATTVGPDTAPPTVITQNPASGASGVATGAVVTAIFSEAIDVATINATTFELRDASNTQVTATVAYDVATRTATLTPSSALAVNTTYTVTVKGGVNGVKDLAGNALAANVVWPFTTAPAGTPACTGTTSIWPINPTPALIAAADTASVELGVKFKSTVNGSVCGIRFYKGSTNTGTHVGTLWSSTGQQLAQATFINETASGWQQVNFANPVAITANTVYVASYHAAVGRYSVNGNYFTAGVTSGPLYALSSAESGGNGVYLYGAGGFPTNTYQSGNYWVDVVFTTSTGPDTTPPTVTMTSPAANATGVNPANPVAMTFSEAMDPATIKSSTIELRDSGNTPLAATVSYAANTATLTPSSALAVNTTYTATVKGGPNGAKDLAGNPLAADWTWSFTTGDAVVWYAGDMHVHRSCGGPPEEVSSIYDKMSTNNLAVVSLLADMGNGEVQIPLTDLPLVNGQDATPPSTPGRLVHWDAEWHWDAIYTQYPHQALGGHVVALGLTEAHQIWEEYTYPIFQWAHQQNPAGIAGFVHMQYLDNVDQNGIPQSLTCCTPIEYPVEVALGAADFIAEDVTGSDSAIQAYYRLLNTGFRPGLAAGSDYPCGVSELGPLLTYVKVAGGQMTYRNWIEGIKQGRTVISRNGHNEFLDLKMNDSATPGDEIKLAAAGSVQVQINWTANQNLSGTIELVQNGVVIASQPVTAATTANLTTPVNFTKSGWLAARRMDGNGHQVHTGAVFVIVNNAPVRASAVDAQFYVQWIDNLLTKTSPGGTWNSYFPTNLAAAQARYQAAKAIYQQIAVEADATAPSAPAGLNATPTSATQINLTWTASIDNVAVTGYQVERCQGAGCSNFAQITMPTATSFSDSGLTATTTYQYRVRATDAAGNLSAYSAVASATTQTPPDMEPPTVPAGLNATPTSATQINLTWTASIDNVAVTGYQVERCQGAGCSNFAQITMPTATSFSDSGLTATTTYQYRVRATDAAGNLSAYSAVASATTQAAPASPTAVNDTFLFRANISRMVNYTGLLGSGVLANDTDLANLPLTAVVVTTLPTGVTLASNGVVTINRGTATTFRYRANNGSALSLPTTGALVTLAINAIPTTAADNCTYVRSGNGGSGSIGILNRL
ncbi:MAG: DUF4082 domain-containing protein [Candidatus Competibacteraceae bacterium]